MIMASCSPGFTQPSREAPGHVITTNLRCCLRACVARWKGNLVTGVRTDVGVAHAGSSVRRGPADVALAGRERDRLSAIGSDSEFSGMTTCRAITVIGAPTESGPAIATGTRPDPSRTPAGRASGQSTLDRFNVLIVYKLSTICDMTVTRCPASARIHGRRPQQGEQSCSKASFPHHHAVSRRPRH